MQEIFRGKETRKKEKEENIRRSKNGEGKGGKYLGTENIFLAEKKNNGEGKYLGKGNFYFGGKVKGEKYLEREERRRKRRKIFQELKKN